MQGRADAKRETSKGAVLATAPFFLNLAKFIAGSFAMTYAIWFSVLIAKGAAAMKAKSKA